MLAIKNAFRFIRWQWNRFDVIPKLAITSMLMTFMSIATMKFDTVSNVFIAIAGICCITMFAHLVFIITKEQYAKFKEERNSLFDIIKHSDKHS